MKTNNLLHSTTTTPSSPLCENPFVARFPRISPVLDTEDEDEFRVFYNTLCAEFNPRSYTEALIFDEIIHVQWHQRRYRAIENAQIALAAARPEVLDQFAEVGGIALTAAAHTHVTSTSRSLQVANRELARLSLEFQRLVFLYVRLHGPIEPLQPIADSPSSDSQRKPGENKPIPINEHHSPKIRAHFTFATAPKPLIAPRVTAITPPIARSAAATAAAGGERKEH